MYLSLLKRAGIHRQVGWAIVEPEELDPCRLRPVLRRMLQLLEEQKDGRMRTSDLFEAL